MQENTAQANTYAEAKERVQAAISTLNEEVERATQEGINVNISVTDSPSGKHLKVMSNFSVKI